MADDERYFGERASRAASSRWRKQRRAFLSGFGSKTRAPGRPPASRSPRRRGSARR
jgi:hypothetical protein